MAIRKSSNSGIPFGNTAARPASPSTGQPYFNGEVGRLELYTSIGWQNIVQETPGIASASGTYNESTGSGTFVLSGTNFVTGGLAYAVGTNGTEYQATTTTINTSLQMTVLFTGLSAAHEPYDIKVLNPSNLFGLLLDAFYINDSPVWSTTAGSLGTWSGSSIQLAATDDESNTITYSVTSGSLPTGLSLSSAGLISGTSTATHGTYTFTVSASDGINTAVTRSFSIIIPVPTITGGTITLSGNYRIHTFTSSGTFATTAPALNVDYLVVAGGGGGGGAGQSPGGGGGGAGGLLSGNLTINPENYSIVVGSGGGLGTGDAGAGPVVIASNGNNSSAFSLVSIGGGRGGAYSSYASNNGGSGGGGLYGSDAGSGTAGQGNSGGVGGQHNSQNASGGGGAGAVGGAAGNLHDTQAGVGGAGVQSSISGTALFYAGGGGGGQGYNGDVANPNGYVPGGSGVGGQGGRNISGSLNALPATASTGSGGGGGGGGFPGNPIASGSSGADGIVIVRYLKSVVNL